MTERLSDKNPCTNCKADRQIGNPNRWECECSRCDKPNDWKNDCIKKLAEYETAEDEGRLVVLPCKVGDTVWTFYDDMSGVADFTVEKIQIVFDKNGKPYFLLDGMDFGEDCLGIALFFSEEEAEKALKEMAGNQSE